MPPNPHRSLEQRRGVRAVTLLARDSLEVLRDERQELAESKIVGAQRTNEGGLVVGDRGHRGASVPRLRTARANGEGGA